MLSSWKLESSSTQTSGNDPASSRRISAVSAAGEMFPATSQSTPAVRHMLPATAVTVLLPFVPVIASRRAPGWPARKRAKSSISPTTSSPRARASRMTGVSSDTPGLAATSSIPSRSASVNAPVTISASGTAARSASSAGGAARVSATRTVPP